MDDDISMDLQLGDIVVRPLNQPAIVSVETIGGEEEVGMISSSVPSQKISRRLTKILMQLSDSSKLKSLSLLERQL